MPYKEFKQLQKEGRTIDTMKDKREKNHDIISKSNVSRTKIPKSGIFKPAGVKD